MGILKLQHINILKIDQFKAKKNKNIFLSTKKNLERKKVF